MAGIYIHIPYCKTRCPYCDFFTQTDLSSRSRFEEALLKEMEMRRGYLEGAAVETIYFGGGTPSLFTPVQLRRIVDAVYRHFHVEQDAEITLEANPDDVDRPFFDGVLSAGINRLSLGTQSFIDEELRFLGRRHNAAQNHRALEDAFAAGFKNVSADLIYGLPIQALSGNSPLSGVGLHRREDPGKTPLSGGVANGSTPLSGGVAVAYLLTNLQTFFSYPITHLSAYHLTIEPGTPFGRQKERGALQELSEHISLQQFEKLIQFTREKGMEQYEISNFAWPGYRSRHNSSYWQRKPYLGLGPSAHSYNTRSRHWSVSHLKQYLEAVEQGHLPLEEEQLDRRDHFNEHVITALRTSEGIDLDEVEKLYGKDYLEYLVKTARSFLDKGQLLKENNHLKMSRKGMFISDAILRELIR